MVDTSSSTGFNANLNTKRKSHKIHDPLREILKSFVLAKAATLARFGYLQKAESLLIPLATSEIVTDDILVLLAKVYAQQGRRDESRRMWEQVLELNPFHIEARNAIDKVETLPKKQSYKLIFQGIFVFVIVGLTSSGVFYFTSNKSATSLLNQSVASDNLSNPKTNPAMNLPTSPTENPEEQATPYVISLMDEQPTPLANTSAVGDSTSPSSPGRDESIQLDAHHSEILPDENSQPPEKSNSESFIPESPELTSATVTSTTAEAVSPPKTMNRSEPPPQEDQSILPSPQNSPVNQALVKEIVTLIQSNPDWKQYGLSVNRNEGVIQIAGEVPSLAIRYQIENFVRSATGVDIVDIGGLKISKSYSVQSGDSLWTIAQRFYGDPIHWIKIAKANGISQSDSIRIGQILTLPN